MQTMQISNCVINQIIRCIRILNGVREQNQNCFRFWPVQMSFKPSQKVLGICTFYQQNLKQKNSTEPFEAPSNCHTFEHKYWWFSSQDYRGRQVFLGPLWTGRTLICQYNMLFLVTVSVPSQSVIKSQQIPNMSKSQTIKTKSESQGTKKLFAQGSYSYCPRPPLPPASSPGSF